MPPEVTVSLVSWNGEKFISDCLASLFDQNFKNFEVIVIDNGSIDATAVIARKFPVIFLQNRINLGFAKAHNQGIKLAKGKYVLTLNQDVILRADFLKTLVADLDQCHDIASVGGKLYRARALAPQVSSDAASHLSHQDKVIDSTGLKILRSRQVVDRGADQIDHGQFDQAEEVFGISAAACLYRKSALESVKLLDQYFDEDYFAYKEDVDLAWRLQLAGWKSRYLPEAIAYHYRGSGPTSSFLVDQVNSWQKRSNLISYHSYKNHLFTLIKNEQFENFLADITPIFSHEIKKLFALAVLKTSQLPVWLEIIASIPRVLRKRQLIKKSVKILAPEFRKAWISQ